MQNAANQALVLLIVFFALSMIVGREKGYRWAWRLISAPIRFMLARLDRQIQFIVTGLVMTVLIGYGIFGLYLRILSALARFHR
jgi:hypothetical protein